MPIYEYKCEKCDREFEVFQRITDPEVKTCKFCHGHARKLVSLSSFHLKGTGWYVTDYGGKKAPSSEGSKNDKKTSSESGEAKKDTMSPEVKGSEVKGPKVQGSEVQGSKIGSH